MDRAERIASTRAACAVLLDAMERTSRTTGLPDAIVARHVAGPTRGRSVVQLPEGFAVVLRDVLALLDEQDAPVPMPPIPDQDRLQNRLRRLDLS